VRDYDSGYPLLVRSVSDISCPALLDRTTPARDSAVSGGRGDRKGDGRTYDVLRPIRLALKK
jgi:hypothetical protein